MAGMIAQWDVEAQLLQEAGCANIKRLCTQAYLRAHLLAHRIRRKQMQLPTSAQEPQSLSQKQAKPRPGFLPQTFVAASFLFALTPPEQIVALPADMRCFTQLYPKALLDQVRLDITPFATEEIWASEPHTAFVAHYSKPDVCEALKQQGIRLCFLNAINSIEEVQSAILKVGRIVGQEEEAELLTLFMEAAFCALDNRFLQPLEEKKESSTLYVNHFSQFTAPSLKTLTGKLLHRLQINTFLPLQKQGNQVWQLPLSQEELIECAPDTILLSCTNVYAIRENLLHDPSLASLPAVRKGRIFALDPVVQNSPTQFAVLAYYDLVHTLLGAAE